MIRVCVTGANGRMGRRILELAHAADDITIGAGVDVEAADGISILVGGESHQSRNVKLYSELEEPLLNSDVLIDFTAPDAAVKNVQLAVQAGKPAVVGTTGFDMEQRARFDDFAQEQAIVLAPNMSVGVNLLFMLTSLVAKTLGLDYNCEITEIHHNQKKDAPSGTAVRLAERAAEALGLEYDKDVRHGREGMTGARPKEQIGMHALRGGDVVGEHTVSFVGQGERVELVHKAHSRDTFAAGSLVAARFAVKANPGLYDMQDVLGLK